MFLSKPFAFGFDYKALRLIFDYFRHHKQRTKIARSYSSRQEILYRVHQGSILGQLFSNADICDICITPSHYDMANYGDDNTPYISGGNIEEELDL